MKKNAFIGFDGFIDQLVRPVKSRENDKIVYYSTISEFAQKLASAAGKSADIEIITQAVKLGGNAPIMADALGKLDVDSLCAGAMGSIGSAEYATFSQSKISEIVSLCDPAYTYAYEFNDGKLMFADIDKIMALDYSLIRSAIGTQRLTAMMDRDLIALVNWSFLPAMHEVWSYILSEVMPILPKKKRHIFFDIADPSKRSSDEICNVFKLMGQFVRYGNVTIGLNENEAVRAYAAISGYSSDTELTTIALRLADYSKADSVVIHPIGYSVAASGGETVTEKGETTSNPVVTTGGGDNFNAGFCKGLLDGQDMSACLKLGMDVGFRYVSGKF